MGILNNNAKLRSALVGVGLLISVATSGAVDVFATNVGGSSGVNVTLDDTISLTILNDAATPTAISGLEFTIDPDGELHAKNTYARVSTNAAAGYRLTLEMNDASTDLVQSGATKQIVGTVENNVTANTMRQNSWGYSLDTTNFSKVPAKGSAVIIKTGAKTTTNVDAGAYEDTLVAFGVKVDALMTSGAYTNTVVFTVVSNE